MGLVATEMSWDDIKALLAELAIQSKETDRKFQETDRLMKERSAELDRKFQETDRRFQEINRRLDEIELLLKKRLKQAERRFQGQHEQRDLFTQGIERNSGAQVDYLSDLKDQFKPKGEKIPKIRYSNQVIDKYTERIWQRAIDDGIIDPYDTDIFIDMLLEPELVALLKRLDRNCTGYAFYKGGYSVSREGEKLYFDFLLRSNHVALAVAFRHVLNKEAVNQLLSKMRRIKRLAPTMADCAIYGVVAGMAIEDDAAIAATEAGFWILAYSDKHEKVVALNEPSFAPQVW